MLGDTMHKRCCTCKQELSLDCFAKNSSTKDGLRPQCKVCRKSQYKPEQGKIYRDKAKESLREYHQKRYQDKKEFILERQKVYQELNKDSLRTYQKSYYESKKTDTEYKKKKRAWFKSWADRNKGRLNAKTNQRRVLKLNATPAWLTESHKEEILYLYELARDITITTGEPYHVDHIVPLKGNNVCGLHVPWNLQILPADLNLKKSNFHQA